MDVSEQKRKVIPGVREILQQIKVISESISKIDAEMKSCTEKIQELVAAQNANSPRAQLMNDLKAIKDEIAELKNEKSAIHDENERLKSECDALKAERDDDKDSGISFSRIEDIDRRIEQLNLRIISESLTPTEEKNIASDLLSLRQRRSKMGEFEEKAKIIKRLENAQKENKIKITQLFKLIDEKNAAREALKQKYDSVASQEKVKSPEVCRLEARIQALKAERPELLNKKLAKKDEINAIKDEYARLESEIEAEIEREETRNKIKSEIFDLKNKRDSIISAHTGFDPKIFDSLIFTCNALKKAKVFVVDIDLANSLIKNKINIPSSPADIDKVIAALKAKSDEAKSNYKSKNDEIKQVLDQLDAKIEAETEKLNKLPPTNVELLKKGRYKSNFKNNKY